MPRDVFISHSAQDKKAAETICAALEQDGIRCWVAPRDVRPGKPFPGEITRAIRQCKVLLLIFSRASNESEQVLREVQLAVDCRLPIVRLRLADVPLSDDLRYYLSTPHWLDALTPPLTKHVPQLIAALKELLGPSVDEAPAAVPAAIAPRAGETAAASSVSSREKKSIGSRPAFAIAWAVVVVAALAFGIWTRSTKKSVAPPSSPTPSLPSPTVVAQSSPTATATAVASPTPTVVEPSPTPEPKPTPNPKAPSTRNNRDWQLWINEFVHNFIASNETNDLDLAISFYAPNVDLFEEGRKSIDAIRQDIESYNARWPSRRATIRGDVRLTEWTADKSFKASFEHDYYVENRARGEWINGAVAVDLQITVNFDGVPKIVSMKQKTLRKDKGMMQKR